MHTMKFSLNAVKFQVQNVAFSCGDDEDTVVRSNRKDVRSNWMNVRSNRMSVRSNLFWMWQVVVLVQVLAVPAVCLWKFLKFLQESLNH